MTGSAVDRRLLEDDDMADLGGVVKYIHTELLTECMSDPLRTTRKYGIDVITRHRFKIRNSDALLASKQDSFAGEFGPFVTYDYGQATNKLEIPLFNQYGDFVGLQLGCSNLVCDVRWPSLLPYNWFSVGNFCPNLSWEAKGSKASPNPQCVRDLAGRVVLGGLCPDGFDNDSFVPKVEPTGSPGCVYTYGKAEVIRLDDLAGITDQDCHTGKCQDWLHFRHNCTDRNLKRMFALNGTIVDVPFCVEHDIHPACMAHCQHPECQALIASGAEVYLGLPFWGGRCDPRANGRRTEQVAAAFGISGGLSSHVLVDQALLDSSAACPRSKDTSWSCAPEIAGMSGPFCSRVWNGACMECWIPGVRQEAGPTSKPWCPLDVFNATGYGDRKDFPLPRCLTKNASDGCCLYAGTCDGSTDPMHAPLNDDGLALVASLRSTDKMEIFLRRAAVGREGATDAVALGWAAYFAWELGPIDRSLAEVLQELDLFASGPRLRPVAAAHRQLVHPRSSAPEVAPVTTHGGCYEVNISFEPLDMEGTEGVFVLSAEACRHKCAAKVGCKHFSFLPAHGASSGMCHLQDLFALARSGPAGAVSGPYQCWDDVADKGGLVQRNHMTIVPSGFECMEWGAVYSPALAGEQHYIPPENASDEEAVLQCQRRCQENAACKHFFFAKPSRLCTLTSGSSELMAELPGAIAGPPLCGTEQKAFYKLFEAEPPSFGDRLRRSGAMQGLAGCAVFLSVFVGAVHVCRASRARVLTLRAPSDVDGDEEEFEALVPDYEDIARSIEFAGGQAEAPARMWAGRFP